MLPYRPVGLQRRSYSYPLQLLVLAVLGLAIGFSAISLLVLHAAPAPALDGQSDNRPGAAMTWWQHALAILMLVNMAILAILVRL